MFEYLQDFVRWTCVCVGEKVSRLDVSNRGGMKTSASCVAISPGEEGVTNGYP